MGKGMELLTGITTAAGTTFTALTMQGGDSLTVRNTVSDQDAKLLAAWCKHQADGILRVRSVRMHDATNGIRLKTTIEDVHNLLPFGVWSPLKSGETITVEQQGSATSGDIDIACLLVYYDDLAGVDARLIDSNELRDRLVNIVAIQNTLASGTSGAYTGSEAINAETDVFKANTDYAVLGMLVNEVAGVVTLKGPDTGNMRVGIPCDETRNEEGRDFFVKLSDMSNLPTIPVINGDNKNNTDLECVQDEDGADPIVTVIYAELKPR